MHIFFVISNNSSVPYFKWFAERAANHKEYKFTFVALTDERPEMIEDVGGYGFDCIWIKFDVKKRKRSMVRTFFKMSSILRNVKPDVVHTHLFDDGLPCMIAAWFSNIKIRVHTKQSTAFHWYYSPKAVPFDRLINRLATNLVAVSEECKLFVLNKEKAQPQKVEMIHHGIPVDFFSTPNEQYCKELIRKFDLEGKLVLGTVSRLIEWKGYKYIIAAAVKVVKRYHNARFLFVGTGPQEEELKELVAKHDLEKHVVFTGWISREYIPSLYSILDGYVHAASYEPFGFVIPEAMMSGTPVVSTPTGSALDVIEHKENGFLAEYQDVDTLVEGIEFIIKNGNELGSKGKVKSVDMFDFNRMYDSYIRLYLKNK